MRTSGWLGTMAAAVVTALTVPAMFAAAATPQASTHLTPRTVTISGSRVVGHPTPDGPPWGP
jgi:hypothetical protein